MFRFPFTNFHELNLDWILSVVKQAKEVFDNGQEDIDYAVETANDAKTIAEQAAQATIPDGAVTTIKLANEAVTNPKLANGSVTSGKLANESVTILKFADGTLIRRNMLDNWFFGGGGSPNSFPINQRGQSVYNLDNSVGFDRWYGVNTRVNIAENSIGLKLGNGGTLRQRFRQKLASPLRPGTYTASMICIINTNDNNALKLAISDGNTIQQSSTENFETSTTAKIIKWTFTNLQTLTDPYFEIITDRTSSDVLADLTIIAIKLELGITQTLGYVNSSGGYAISEFPDYNEELLKCERFLVKMGNVERIRACLVATNSIQFFVPLPAEIYKNPDNSNFASCEITGLNGGTQTGFTISVLTTATGSNGIMLSANKTAHGMTDASLNLNGILISAE